MVFLCSNYVGTLTTHESMLNLSGTASLQVATGTHYWGRSLPVSIIVQWQLGYSGSETQYILEAIYPAWEEVMNDFCGYFIQLNR